MHEPATLSRRRLVAALPIAALAGATPLAAAAMPALREHADGRLEAATARCRAAHQAFAAAIEAYEDALPAPHASLDMTGFRSRPFSAAAERRLCDGETPKRAIDGHGKPTERYVANEETIEKDIFWCPPEDRDRRRLLYRMRRRARARAAQVERLEESFCLDERRIEVGAAQRVLEELAQELFATPATSMAAVLVQAKVLSAYTETIKACHAAHQAGRFGIQLATNLQTVARAA